MILVDTSVIIPFCRGSDAKLSRLFSTIAISTCGIVRAEILHGARTPAERLQLSTILAAFPTVVIREPVWDDVGDLLALLRSKGITIPFPDAVLASVAIAEGLELWTRDNHFSLVQTVEPRMRLFVEPP